EGGGRDVADEPQEAERIARRALRDEPLGELDGGGGDAVRAKYGMAVGPPRGGGVRGHQSTITRAGGHSRRTDPSQSPRGSSHAGQWRSRTAFAEGPAASGAPRALPAVSALPSVYGHPGLCRRCR